MTNSTQELTQFVKNKAADYGFFAVGISRARHLSELKSILQSWLNMKMHGEMHYMENHFEKRLDPRLLVEGCKSVITVLLNYYPEKEILLNGNFKISKYAYGRDYHSVIKEKLNGLLADIEQRTGTIKARIFSDSAPVMDKAWAREGGLGWIGKNTCLINKDSGSFFFIGHLITDLELEYDNPFDKDHCGSCDRCIKACPTEAITESYQLDARKCISYLNIEYRNKFPKGVSKQLDQWIFGCDICQDVCPWNKKAVSHKEKDFIPSGKLLSLQKDDWEHLTEEIFNELFEYSAVSRIKYNGFMRNIQAVTNQLE